MTALVATAAFAKKPAVWRHAGFPIRIMSGSRLDQRSSRGRALRTTAAARTIRFGFARHRALARAGELLRLRRPRPFDIFEADLPRFGLRTGLILDQHDADMAATLEFAEQHFVCQRLLDVLLDHARHRPRAHLLIIAMLH